MGYMVRDSLISTGLIVETLSEDRVFFIMTYKNHAIIGAREVVQDSTEEEADFVDTYNHYSKYESSI